MKKINNKQNYRDLINTLVTLDATGEKSVVKVVLINKMINYLYVKLPEDQKKQMVDMLRNGISNEFIAFMDNNLSEEDQIKIAKIVTQELEQIYNSALIAHTNAGERTTSRKAN